MLPAGLASWCDRFYLDTSWEMCCKDFQIKGLLVRIIPPSWRTPRAGDALESNAPKLIG